MHTDIHVENHISRKNEEYVVTAIALTVYQIIFKIWNVVKFWNKLQQKFMRFSLKEFDIRYDTSMSLVQNVHLKRRGKLFK